MQPKKQLCKIPEFIEFEYYPEQELHSFIDIQNLTDQIVSFRIKTTAPAEYLVKPMEGQIYKKQKAKIVFKRKKLSAQNFEAIQNGTKPLKEKFMFIITCKSKNAIGIEKTDEMNSIMSVKFASSKKPYQEPSPVKKTKKVKTLEQKRQQAELLAVINVQKNKLQELKKQREAQQVKLENAQSLITTGSGLQSVQQSKVSSVQLSQVNIICLVLLFLLLGMVL